MDEPTPLGRLIPAEEVLRRGAGRWKSLPSLAAATRGGSGPKGRVLLSSNRAAYVEAEVEAFFRKEEEDRPARLEVLRGRAAVARAARAAKRVLSTPGA